jgi:lycopene cyclase domain-containing protein
MTYLAFLLFFLVLPIAVLLGLQIRTLRRREIASMAVVGAIALLYTTPWDDAIIRQGVWSYPAERVLGITIGQVPLEECLFYVLQVALAGLTWRLVRPIGGERRG